MNRICGIRMSFDGLSLSFDRTHGRVVSAQLRHLAVEPLLRLTYGSLSVR
jgi:hypothetical protein